MIKRIAIISDVHANLPALEAVWAHAQQQKASELWHAGDHVGYNAFPEETIQWLIENNAVSVLGDYDLRMLRVHEKRSEWEKTKAPIKLQALLWAHEQLSSASLEYLQQLPRQRVLSRLAMNFLINHGSPAAIDEGLAPGTSKKRLRKLAGKVDVHVVLSGDSHRAFKREVDGVTFINPGSVGRPDDGDPRASYGILRLQEGSLDTKLYRVEYDIDRAVAAIRRAKLPEEFAQMMIRGRSFNDLDKK